MKKYILGLIAIVVLSFTTKAQSIASATQLAGGTQTVTNTGAATYTVKVTDSYEVTTFQVNVNKTSGTVSGKVYLQAALDGVNYSNIDSLTLIDKTLNTKLFLASINKYLWYKVSYTGVGTQVSTINAYIIARKRG